MSEVNRVKDVKFTVSNQACSNCDPDKHIVANSKDCYRAVFELDDDWIGVSKIARFVHNELDIFEDVDITADNTCCIPDTVLKPGLLKVGVYGGDMTPTEMGFVRVRESVISSTTPEPPKPDVYQQLLQMVTQANDKAALALDTSYDAMVKSGSYVYMQQTDSDYWVIEHPLGKTPSVSAFDEAHNLLIGTVAYVDDHTVTIKFSQAIRGTAVLN